MVSLAVGMPLQLVQGRTDKNDFNERNGDIINNNSGDGNINNNNNINNDGDIINNNSGSSTTINDVNGGVGATKIDPSACAAADKGGSPLQDASDASPYLTCIYQDDTVCRYSLVDGSLFSESGSSICLPLVINSTSTPDVNSATSQSVTASVTSASGASPPVTGSARPLQRLSVGAVAGIVLAVVVPLISLAIFLLCRRHRLRTHTHRGGTNTISPFRLVPEASGPGQGSPLRREKRVMIEEVGSPSILVDRTNQPETWEGFSGSLGHSAESPPAYV
ncbi:hypothetical protein C8R47DRAFT_1165905 [Mycena vitilis]|nr:hypothetical protein C8R47DRAFT_1165905 [Mycena vitilis]